MHDQTNALAGTSKLAPPLFSKAMMCYTYKNSPGSGCAAWNTVESVTFSPMRGSTSLMTGLVAFAKALILALSVSMRTGRNLAVATIAQFQKAATDQDDHNFTVFCLG